MNANPILVDNIRGSTIENRHRGAAAVVDYRGKLIAGWGNIERPVYARSSIKYLQAIPLVESGAADAYKLREREIALACSSHSGEPEHVELVSQWLGAVGLHMGDLKCGRCRPAHGPSYKKLIQTGHDYTQLHNPCSGKHTGFLTSCIHQGFHLENYTSQDHPVQIQARDIVEELMQVEGKHMPVGIDGCGIPAYAYPLKHIALGMSRFSPKSTGLSQSRKEAVARIREAIIKHPYLVAGSHKFDTVMIETTGGKVLTKVGADGVYAACIPHLGLGLALKIDDGNIRAAEVAMGTLLSHYDVFDHSALARLKPFLEPTISNLSKCDTGFLKSSHSWLAIKS